VKGYRQVKMGVVKTGDCFLPKQMLVEVRFLVPCFVTVGRTIKELEIAGGLVFRPIRWKK